MTERAAPKFEITIAIEKDLYRDLVVFMNHVGIEDDSNGVRRVLIQFLCGLDGVKKEEQQGAR